jgi:CubicO group peptidase (beta-lactamase class C family)
VPLLLLVMSQFFSTAYQPTRADLAKALDEIADAFKPPLDRGGGFQAAIQTQTELVSIARGAISKAGASSPVTNDDIFFFGSLTKHVTAGMVFKMVEDEKLNLSTRVHTILDPFLRRTAAQRGYPYNFTSLESIWGQQANSITVNHLGRMQSGIPDNYVDNGLWAEAISAPSHVFSPFELMYKSRGSLNFAPGSSCVYSTLGFSVLGLTLCALQGCGSEHQIDMLAWLPIDLRRKLRRTVFPTNGTPASFSRMHGCERLSGPPVADVSNVAATFAGYTGSFMASTTSETAQIMYAINSPHSDCLSNESRRLMHLVERTDIRPYGFGTEIFAPSFLGMPGGLYSQWGSNGHEGRTYGFVSWSMYIPAMDVSISVITSNEFVETVGIACLVANKVKNMMFNESRVCKYWSSANWQHPGGCHCTTPTPAPNPHPRPAPTPAPAPALNYTCSNNRCVESKDGLPYEKCMRNCALYTCIHNKCVEADEGRGIPLKNCNKICVHSDKGSGGHLGPPFAYVGATFDQCWPAIPPSPIPTPGIPSPIPTPGIPSPIPGHRNHQLFEVMAVSCASMIFLGYIVWRRRTRTEEQSNVSELKEPLAEEAQAEEEG